MQLTVDRNDGDVPDPEEEIWRIVAADMAAVFGNDRAVPTTAEAFWHAAEEYLAAYVAEQMRSIALDTPSAQRMDRARSALASRNALAFRDALDDLHVLRLGQTEQQAQRLARQTVTRARRRRSPTASACSSEEFAEKMGLSSQDVKALAARGVLRSGDSLESWIEDYATHVVGLPLEARLLEVVRTSCELDALRVSCEALRARRAHGGESGLEDMQSQLAHLQRQCLRKGSAMLRVMRDVHPERFATGARGAASIDRALSAAAEKDIPAMQRAVDDLLAQGKMR